MTTQQPVWKFIANLGDVSPIDYGGLFLFEDETGVYAPELEKLERDSDEDDSKFTIHRVTLDRCKEVDGYLVSFNYDSTWTHPVARYDEWFAKDLASVASTMGTTERELRDAFCSDDSKDRAWAYQCVYDHHGWMNGDEYPLTMTLAEVEERYKDIL